jgi:hypothetical protein
VGGGFVVTNAAPVITSVTGSDPVALGSASWLKVKFDDPGVSGDAYTLETTWTDANGNPVTPNGTATLDSYAPPQGQFTYNVTLPSNVYTITVLVKDKFGAASSPYVFRYIVVFDPSGSFVTGGGWIDSPLGACLLTAECEGAIGRANFGFVSKYHRGKNNVDELTGQTQFQFQAGNLNFHSSAYEWLVVGGAKAQYRGTGTLNGVGGYQFVLTAVDGQLNGTGTDRFRIKITLGDGVAYDNQAGEDISELIGDGTVVQGSIVIHEVKRK